MRSHHHSCVRVLLLAASFIGPSPSAPIPISNVKTTLTFDPSYDQVNGTVIDGRTYFGRQLSISQIQANTPDGLQTLVPRKSAVPIVNVVREGPVNPGRTVIWQARDSAGRFLGALPPSEAELYSRNDLYLASDNTFVNDGTAPSTNIERLDFVLDNVLVVKDTRYVAVLDRGPQNGHDGFGIAAILSVDAQKKPTSWGHLVRIAPGWANGPQFALSSGVGTVFTREANSSTLTQRALINGQRIAGLLVPYADLAAVNSKIYGYSIVAYDVNPATHDSSVLGQVSNNSIFPKNTGQVGSGLDLPAIPFGTVDQVPEPSTWATAAVGLIACSLLRRRREPGSDTNPVTDR